MVAACFATARTQSAAGLGRRPAPEAGAAIVVMIRVSSLDAGMLYAETPEMPMHTMGVLILERPSHSIFEALGRVIETRLHLLAPFRRRLLEDPLQLGDPYWIEDPDFALENHLRRAAIPSPGSMRELADFVGDAASRLLDRAKPLWELQLVEGLEGGRVAVVTKIHHAAMDGGRLVGLIGALLDLTPEGRELSPPEEDWTADHEPTFWWLAADAARALAAKPFGALRSISQVGTTILGGTRPSRAGKGDAAKLFEAPSTPLNGALSPQRVVAMADVAFDDVKVIKKAFGTTVNDVVLAASCGALRSWLLAHGGLPERPLVANVPVTVRTEGQDETGNRVSMILAHLPVMTEDPLERLLTIYVGTQRAKKLHGNAKGDVFRQTTDLLTNITVPWLLTHAVEVYSRGHLADRLPFLWNVVISNLPGPPVPLYCAGARLLRLYPFGPVQQGSGLNLTVMSTVDRLCLGAMACKRMVPDVEDIATGFTAEIAILRNLVDAQR
jgi:diacylglycerol O-acyltransferase